MADMPISAGTEGDRAHEKNARCAYLKDCDRLIKCSSECV